MSYRIHNTNTPEAYSAVYEAITMQLNGKPSSFQPNSDLTGYGLYVTDAAAQPIACCYIYQNAELIWEGKPAHCFGHFETVQNTEAVQFLFSEAQKTSKNLIGPMNGSTWDSYRLATSAASLPFLLDLHTPDYYPALLEAAGFVGIKDYYTNLDTRLYTDKARLAEKQRALAEAQIHFRAISLVHFEQELVALHAFCAESFRNNFLFTPIEQERFIRKYTEIMPYLDADLVQIAEDPQGICGFILAVPNLLDSTNKGLIVKTLARKLEPQYAGLGSVLSGLVYQLARPKGYTYGIHAFMEAENASRKVSAAFAGNLLRTYRLYALQRSQIE